MLGTLHFEFKITMPGQAKDPTGGMCTAVDPLLKKTPS
jgi:hypothetical protein